MVGNLILLAGLFLALFALGEFLHHGLGWRAENSRKVVHSSVGLLAMSFPYFFDVWWPVILLCSAFLLILIVSMRFGFLNSINGVERSTVGSLLFPISVALCFGLSLHMTSQLYYYLPLLILAVCDPLAAVVGNGKEGKKSLRGSVAFFVSAWFLGILLIRLGANTSLGMTLVMALVPAVVTTLAEYVSGNGWDNLSIPGGAALSLWLVQMVFPWS